MCVLAHPMRAFNPCSSTAALPPPALPIDVRQYGQESYFGRQPTRAPAGWRITDSAQYATCRRFSRRKAHVDSLEFNVLSNEEHCEYAGHRLPDERSRGLGRLSTARERSAPLRIAVTCSWVNRSVSPAFDPPEREPTKIENRSVCPFGSTQSDPIPCNAHRRSRKNSSRHR